jgi:hypothetical protein
VTEVHHGGTDKARVDAIANLCHGSGRLRAGDQRQLDRIRAPGTVLQVDVVDPDPAVADEGLAGPGHRIRELSEPEFLRPAITGDLHCEHN